MKKEKPKPKKKNKTLFYKIISFILIVISVLSAGVIIYFEILPTKYLIPLLIFMGLIIFGISYKLNTRTWLFTKLIMTLFSILILILEGLGIIYAFGTLDFLNNIFDTGYRMETYNVYVLKDSEYQKIKDLNDKIITVYSANSDTLEKALDKLYNKISFTKNDDDSIANAVDDLINQKTEALFISETLMHIYKEDHEDVYANLRVLDSVETLTKTESEFASVDVSKKPFVMYLSGSDLEGSIKKVSRSDVNLLVVVNPKTGKILILNTPRDYYVTLATKNAKDKLTHAGIYGIEESALTLGKLYGVDVNYYARVNFTSFVKIIDALGGVEVDSKYAFSYDGSTFKKGINKLNGKQALAFSRGRKMLPEGDISRGENQQALITGLIKKLSDKTVLTKYTTLLNSLESGVMTNIDKNVITKLVNMQLDENISWSIENYAVKGKDSYNKTYSTGSANVYVMEPDMDSLTEAKTKINDILMR